MSVQKIQLECYIPHTCSSQQLTHLFARSGTVSEKALKVLGATQDDVRLERAILVSQPDDGSAKERIFVEYTGGDDDEVGGPPPDDQPKAGRLLGIPGEQNLDWLNRRTESPSKPAHRRVPSKALLTLGATIDDVRIEKALLVLGEAPGRQIPGGKLPRPRADLDDDKAPSWAVASALASEHSGVSVFLCAFFPWGVLAPLNVLKLQLNKVLRPRQAGRSAQALSRGALPDSSAARSARGAASRLHSATHKAPSLCSLATHNPFCSLATHNPLCSLAAHR